MSSLLSGLVYILLFCLIILGLTRPLGIYLFRVFEGERKPLPWLFGPVERAVFRLCNVDPQQRCV